MSGAWVRLSWSECLDGTLSRIIEWVPEGRIHLRIGEPHDLPDWLGGHRDCEGHPDFIRL